MKQDKYFMGDKGPPPVKKMMVMEKLTKSKFKDPLMHQKMAEATIERIKLPKPANMLNMGEGVTSKMGMPALNVFGKETIKPMTSNLTKPLIETIKDVKLAFWSSSFMDELEKIADYLRKREPSEIGADAVVGGMIGGATGGAFGAGMGLYKVQKDINKGRKALSTLAQKGTPAYEELIKTFKAESLQQRKLFLKSGFQFGLWPGLAAGAVVSMLRSRRERVR